MYGTVHDIRTYYEELACELVDGSIALGLLRSGFMIKHWLANNTRCKKGNERKWC